MTVKSHFPWPVKLAGIICAVAIGGAAALWMYDLGRQFTGVKRTASPDIAAYQQQLDKLSAERDRAASTVNSADSRLVIERSVQKQLSAQVKTLEAENSKLKEDLAFFEGLLPAGTGSPTVSIRRLQVEMTGPNQLRYRLLVMQGARGKMDFSGSLQLAVTALQAGRSSVILFPSANAADADKFALAFRHYQRVEGVLTIPDGVSAKAVQARVLERGQVRTQLSANL
ncbi:DUF6776 family protein [Actimicrobium antarcticum]|uniref:Uncharacterized protein n=1 Tax=Actimicrobium antarcticum TaxID=1051899 RepID=A0ABP7SN33_9BURK